jgi:hypothetical protein
MTANMAGQHSLDIEATIRNGGLDIGAFGPEKMLGNRSAHRMIGELVELLQGVEE